VNVRAKFRVASVEYWGSEHDETSPRNYTLHAMYDTSTLENERFTKFTPSGELKIRVENPAVKFEVGKYYYLDFTLAAS
jgi:hypothetical protein